MVIPSLAHGEVAVVLGWVSAKVSSFSPLRCPKRDTSSGGEGRGRGGLRSLQEAVAPGVLTQKHTGHCHLWPRLRGNWAWGKGKTRVKRAPYRPLGPRKPVAWHSSMKTRASYFWASWQISLRGAMSPSMEKAPSVATSRRRCFCGRENGIPRSEDVTLRRGAGEGDRDIVQLG